MPNNYENNFSSTHLNLIQPDGTIIGTFDVDQGHFARLIVNGQSFFSYHCVDSSGNITGDDSNSDFTIYKDDDNNYYIKPNDLFDEVECAVGS